jgi:hypothetical protein
MQSSSLTSLSITNSNFFVNCNGLKLFAAIKLFTVIAALYGVATGIMLLLRRSDQKGGSK